MLLWVSCSSRSLLPAGNGCDPVCVKAAPAQRLSSSDHWSPAPVAPVVLQLDSLQSFPDLWSAVWPQSGFSQWSGWAQWRSSHCPPLLSVPSAVRTHITITQWLQWVLTETSQTALLLQTHLMSLHSLSQLLKIFLSLLDPLLERPLRLLQLVLKTNQ